MGQVISSKADPAKIEAHVREALANATARGGDIGAAAAERLTPAVAEIDSGRGMLDGARVAEGSAWAPVLAADDAADAVLGAVRDAMWNALGRPSSSPDMSAVFPGGVRTYTSGDPSNQPMLMELLRERIAASSVPKWSADKATWIAQIEAARVPLAQAVDTYRPLDAALTIGAAAYRTAVRSAHAQLTRFKRDLKNLGLTETQIHEVIPDAPTPRSTPEEPPPN